MSDWKAVPRVSDCTFLCREAYKTGCPQETLRLLLISRVWATIKGTVSFGRASTVLQCGCGGPNLEGVQARGLGTEF